MKDITISKAENGYTVTQEKIDNYEDEVWIARTHQEVLETIADILKSDLDA